MLSITGAIECAGLDNVNADFGILSIFCHVTDSLPSPSLHPFSKQSNVLGLSMEQSGVLTTDGCMCNILNSKLCCRLTETCVRCIAQHLLELVQDPLFGQLVKESAETVQNREDVDSVPIIDDIRYHVTVLHGDGELSGVNHSMPCCLDAKSSSLGLGAWGSRHLLAHVPNEAIRTGHAETNPRGACHIACLWQTWRCTSYIVSAVPVDVDITGVCMTWICFG